MHLSRYHTILDYHEATKHHFHRYARSAGHMDWTNQPTPFRFYEDVERIAFSLTDPDPALSYNDLHEPDRNKGQPLTLATLGSFFKFSLGLSAWKKAGTSRWSLRVNPSSGNLHPTEGYLITPHMSDLCGGVYHYTPILHALEQRASFPKALWPPLEAHFQGPGFLVALSTIFWRESWKYGERAYRYCNLDAGHALAALAYAARLHHWRLMVLNGAGDGQIGTLLGFDRTSWPPIEAEVPELICWVAVTPGSADLPSKLPENFEQSFASISFEGRPNPLSRQPVDWSIIGQAAEATEKPVTSSVSWAMDEAPNTRAAPTGLSATAVMLQRRSAVSFNPQKFLPAHTLSSILDQTLARASVPPFEVRLLPPAVHLLVFAHRVSGLAPGLYLLVRRQSHLADLRRAMKADFKWQAVGSDLPLWLLKEGDYTFEAMELSCHQEIAGNSAFAVAMIASFKDLTRDAPYHYRHLLWECGMIGQVLYLAAEAHGIRGTGIGCFFDDAVHQLLGLTDNTFQSLYHFTVGHPIEDDRLTTLPAYHHLDGAHH